MIIKTSQTSPKKLFQIPFRVTYSSQLFNTCLIFPFGFEHIDLIFLISVPLYIYFFTVEIKGNNEHHKSKNNVTEVVLFHL